MPRRARPISLSGLAQPFAILVAFASIPLTSAFATDDPIGRGGDESRPRRTVASPAVRCPECKEAVRWESGRGVCPCGRGAGLIGGVIPDFLGDVPVEVANVFEWPSGFLARAKPWLAAVRSGDVVPAEAVPELQVLGILDAGANPTELGVRVAYDLAEYDLQARADELPPSAFARTMTGTARVI